MEKVTEYGNRLRTPGGVMDLEWTEQLSVGNAAIDSDHKKLITMVNGVTRGIKAGDSHILSQVFEQLENWLGFHFTKEARIAQAVNFPFGQHRVAQQHGLRELQHIRNELVSKNGIWSEGAVEHFCLFLENWAIEHITKVDMLMKPALQTRPYDFQPD